MSLLRFECLKKGKKDKQMDKYVFTSTNEFYNIVFSPIKVRKSSQQIGENVKFFKRMKKYVLILSYSKQILKTLQKSNF